MSKLDLDAIEARANASTVGPWEWVANEDYTKAILLAHSGTENEQRLAKLAPNRADAEFIAHAREDVPALIAEVRRLSQRPSDEALRWSIRLALNETLSMHQAGRAADAVLALFPKVEV